MNKTLGALHFKGVNKVLELTDTMHQFLIDRLGADETTWGDASITIGVKVDKDGNKYVDILDASIAKDKLH